MQRNETQDMIAGPACPECGASATILYCHPHKFAGIWECINPECGASDTHEHENIEIETTEDWPTSPNDEPREYDIYVCADCGVQVDGDPAEDRADAIADSQIMEELGK